MTFTTLLPILTLLLGSLLTFAAQRHLAKKQFEEARQVRAEEACRQVARERVSRLREAYVKMLGEMDAAIVTMIRMVHLTAQDSPPLPDSELEELDAAYRLAPFRVISAMTLMRIEDYDGSIANMCNRFQQVLSGLDLVRLGRERDAQATLDTMHELNELRNQVAAAMNAHLKQMEGRSRPEACEPGSASM